MKILLVRLRLIGDVTFTTPLLRTLRRRFPEAHLAYLVEPAAEPVIRGNPHLDQIIVTPRRRGLARVRDDLALAWRLRREQFDVVIDLHGGPRSAWLTWASGASRRIGYTIAGRSWMYTDVVQRAPDLTPRHSVLNQWDLLSPLGVEAPSPDRDPLEMVDDPVGTASLHRRLRDAGITAEPLIAVHVSAGNPFRRWPEAAFVDMVCALVRRDPRRRIALFSGPSDAEAARRITLAVQARLGDLAAAVPYLGHLGLGEIRALAAASAVYIGGDSGPLHIASTTTTPIVALLGPTLAARSMPWRDPRWFAEAVQVERLACRPCHQRTCVPGDFRCLTGITPEQVVAAAERALAYTVSNEASNETKAMHA
ncbi:MAG: glycosyltransferase family 9 protein [Acidobacteria bacterium]|nr:glycosyltransferase family 9 protein [Acidobacteriota bacterium]